MRILIAGATGLIGSSLVQLCLNEGIKVNYLTTSKSKIQNTKNYKGFYWNPKKGILDEAAFKDVTTIINLAGTSVSKRWTYKNRKEIYNSRVDAANLIYEQLSKSAHMVTHYISASAIGIYPPSFTEMYTEESTAVDNSFLGKVVVAWEEAANKFNALGIRVACIRTGLVLDAKQGAFPQLVAPIKMGLGSALGSGKQWVSWIAIEDVTAIYMHCMKHGLEGVINAVAPSPVTNFYMTRRIAKKLNKKLWLPKVPSFVLRIVLGKMAALVIDGQLVHSDRLKETDFEFKYVSVEATIKNLLKEA